MAEKNRRSSAHQEEGRHDDVVLRTRGLTKHYGSFVAVDNLDLTIRRGEVFGLLGPNGSGKTTTILMLLGLTDPTAGTVEVLGFDPQRHPLSVKARVGYLPDQVGFYDNLTGRENLTYIAKLNGIPRAEAYRRIDEALDRMGLAEAADRPVSTYSRGMRQRLGVAELLLKHPQIIIMDEPTLGLDPEAARLFLRIIRDLRDEGITILLSSHLLYQVQEVCDRVGLFSRGRMVLEGTVQSLAQRVLGGAYRVHLEAQSPNGAVADALGRLPDVVAVRQEGDRYILEARRDLRAEAARAVVEAGGRLLSLDVEAPSLDEIYARYFQEMKSAEAQPAASKREEVKHGRNP
ncbi:ABC transporter ATP-binding protein [Litorilinea aerophila]|uniref:ABC transporter ATP-binding protein n=1 Tax=Litorilinea aerophila TaxID=1204385 RepID=A0A540VGS6_9CHLR|nr:ABC transporter ATP-binding protein [Litorilinea aerophila]MCC9076353.1 ABC transporter ATP-binding protein [Litorilinea aerophila]GIV78087.1 MAG: ABC transporter ATP-binding protein [Litorilinea sp.]